jgi:plastocyanin
VVTSVVTGTITVNSESGKKPTAVYVYVVDDEDAPGTARPKFEIAQKNTQFSPRVLVVPAGARVDFPNRDKEVHNVFANHPVFFDLGRGRKQFYEFLDPGEYDIYCDIHEQMSAKVRVMPSSRFAPVAADGTYRIEVPVGKQKLEVWYPDAEKKHTRPIEVVEGQPLTLDFKVNTVVKARKPHTRIDNTPYPRW